LLPKKPSLLGDRYDVDAVAISMGSPDAVDALKHALAMGVGAAALVDNSGVTGADMWTTAAALAAAVKAEGVELVITGKQSVDDNSGAVYAGVAARLGWPLVSAVTKVVEIAGGRITVERMVEGAQETVSVPLPAVVSVGKEINEPRYPSFMGIRKASKANIPATPAASLGVASAAARRSGPTSASPKNARRNVVMIDGASVEEKAAKLADALMAEKVI
jgi:electron transfer flavoprotein beta subunit